jgi:hypothetical protein
MYGYTTKNILTSRDVHEALQAKTEALGSRPRRDGETEAFANLSKVRPRHSSSRLTLRPTVSKARPCEPKARQRQTARLITRKRCIFVRLQKQIKKFSTFMEVFCSFFNSPIAILT